MQHTCPYVPYYNFDCCVITTCRNWSPILESKCIAQERRECINVDKVMTDYELMYFKNYPTLKKVAKTRRMATEAVHTLLVLDYYYHWCHNLPQPHLLEKVSRSSKVFRLLNKYPYNLKEFVVTYPLLYLMLQVGNFENFQKVCKFSAPYSLSEILFLSERKIERMALHMQRFLSPTGN